MKSKILAGAGIMSLAGLCGCVNVDEEVAAAPSVYWKAPKEAKPEALYAPSQIKTDKIEEDKNSEAAEKPERNRGGELSASEKMIAGKKLELSELSDIALENNTSTRVYWFQAKRYAASVGKAQAAYYPQVSVGGEIYRDKTKPSVGYSLGIPIGAYYETAYGPSAQINWLLCDFGKRGARVDSAKEALRAANFEYNQSIQDVVLAVNVAYFNYCAAVGAVKAALLSLEDAKTSFESADRKLKDGVGNKQDMLNALAAVKSAEFQVENGKAQVETARASLALAMGVEVSNIANIADEMPSLSSPEAGKSIEELVARAMKSRQSLMAQYASLRKTQSDAEIARRDFLPQISANASAAYGWYTQRDRDDQYQYQVGLSASWSVFEGFARKYELVSAKAAERAQAQQLKAEQIKIISDVWAYYHVYLSASKQVESAKAVVEASLEAYKATKIGFDSGVSSITDLLDAQNRLASARQTEVNARASLSSAVARLSHAVGAIGAKLEM